MVTGKVRRQRSDKKWSVQPFVSIELDKCITRLAFITDKHVKDVIEEICKNGIDNKKVMDNLSANFLCDIRINNTVYMGSSDCIRISKRIASGQKTRISTRVSGNLHFDLKVLAYALDCSIARACALLLDATIRDTEFINDFVEEYLVENVDAERITELKKVLKYIQVNNPYEDVISWAALLDHLVEEVRIGAEKVQDTVTTFIINNWKK